MRNMLTKFESALMRALGHPRIRKIPLNLTLLKLAGCFIDYEAVHLDISGRVVEYGFVLSKLMSLPKGRVLDVGCIALHNYVSPSLAFAGWNVYGIDIRSDWGFKHSNFQLIQRDIREGGFASEWFDAVVCLSTIEHIGIPGYYGNKHDSPDGDVHAAEEMSRITRKGGRILLTAPYYDTYFVRRGARVYDSERLKKMFSGCDVADKRIYVWKDKNWMEIKGSLEKEGIICLELVKR